jgi:superfamily II DNA helicase RecQ
MTATLETRMRDAVKRTLGMRNVHVIIRSANRINIFYGVGKATTLEKLADWLVRGLQNYRVHYPKTIVFCRK